MIFELREYVAYDSTAQMLHDRFRDTTLPLFGKHGLKVVGFWADQQQPSRLLYVLEFADEEAKHRAWADFKNDPAWHSAKADSERNGPIVESMSSRPLVPVDYWPGA